MGIFLSTEVKFPEFRFEGTNKGGTMPMVREIMTVDVKAAEPETTIEELAG